MRRDDPAGFLPEAAGISVGGGSPERNVSGNLVAAVDEAKARRTDVLGIVGRDGGYTGRRATSC